MSDDRPARVHLPLDGGATLSTCPSADLDDEARRHLTILGNAAIRQLRETAMPPTDPIAGQVAALVDQLIRERDDYQSRFRHAREAGSVLDAAVRGFLAGPPDAYRAQLERTCESWLEQDSGNFSAAASIPRETQP